MGEGASLRRGEVCRLEHFLKPCTVNELKGKDDCLALYIVPLLQSLLILNTKSIFIYRCTLLKAAAPPPPQEETSNIHNFQQKGHKVFTY
jgi:hypothetical protein